MHRITTVRARGTVPTKRMSFAVERLTTGLLSLLVALAAILPASVTPAHAAPKMTQARCQRLAVQAQKKIALSQLPKVKCGVDLTKTCGSSCLGWASSGYWGSEAPRKATVRISKRANGRSDKQVLQVMLHEFSHVKYITASAKKRKAARKVLRVASDEAMLAGSSTRMPIEQLAQAAAVCLGGADWGAYKRLSCAKSAKAHKALS